jgi:hypothetical protein
VHREGRERCPTEREKGGRRERRPEYEAGGGGCCATGVGGWRRQEVKEG